ncbi:MAG TPA: hypothetical protein VLA43_10100 [Longimicrobiales bacterium]|nr:hypothetical protein [Longimicrobiales bacterium]
MSTRLGLWLLLAAAGWGFAFWIYARRELPVRGRRLLALLRGGSLAVVLLLLLDLTLPGRAGSGRSWILLDTSPSMAVPQGDAEVRVPEDRALLALDRADDAEVATFGSPVAVLPPGWRPGGDGSPPDRALDSRLAPALTRALEGGASQVRILTDLRMEDPVEVEALLRSARIPVTFQDLGGDLSNVGVASVDLPAAARAGSEIQGEVVLFGAAPAPVRLVLQMGDTPAWDTTLVLDGGGRRSVPVRLRAPDAAGPVPVRVRVLTEGDGHAGDDARTRVLEVDPDAGELVLVSWLPDWEPRFLLPVLAEVTGLRAQGYLRVGADRFMTMGGPVTFLAGAEVAAALEEARVGVLHGFPEEVPAVWDRARSRAPRLMVIPAGGGPGGQGGEWYVATEIPPSPLAGELAGLPVLGLPPLLGRRDGRYPGTPALVVQMGGRGDPVPAVVLAETPDGRRVEAVAHGFWRWAFRDGTPRELYRRLWSGAAGWLLAGGGPELREVGMAPFRNVVRPGEAVAWRAGPAAGGSVSLRFEASGEAGTAPGQVLSVDSLGRTTAAAPVAAGVYRWEAEVTEGPGRGVAAAGLLVVEEADLDLLPSRAVHLTELSTAGDPQREPGSRRPLRTHPLPYLLLLGLLTAEWVVRRRTGLR